MALYLISYDIAKQDAKEYDGLWALLKQIGAVKILYSEWVVVDAVKRASAIYDVIAPKTMEPDRLLVQEITDDAKWDKLLISDEKFMTLLDSARG